MTMAYGRSVSRGHRGCVKDKCFTLLLFNLFFVWVLLVALERFSNNADILAELAHLQE